MPGARLVQALVCQLSGLAAVGDEARQEEREVVAERQQEWLVQLAERGQVSGTGRPGSPDCSKLADRIVWSSSGVIRSQGISVTRRPKTRQRSTLVWRAMAKVSSARRRDASLPVTSRMADVSRMVERAESQDWLSCCER